MSQNILIISLAVLMLVAVALSVQPVTPKIEAKTKTNVTQLNNSMKDLIDTCYQDKYMQPAGEIGNANICDHAIDVVNILCHLGANSQLSACKSVNLIKYNQ